MLSEADVIHLHKAAERYVRARTPAYGDGECTYLYRNKPNEYFNNIYTECDGIMKTYLKDASGDLRSPINGEICGLFFLATVNNHGQPFPYSPFGDTRVLIPAEEVLGLTPNMFFADFYCMQGRQDVHHVTIVLTKPGSSADEFCNRCLPRLDVNRNPFLYKEDDQMWVSSAKGLFVDVFVTEDLNLKSTIRKMEYLVETLGVGKTSQGGEYGKKTADCEHCDIFCNRPLADNCGIYKLF